MKFHLEDDIIRIESDPYSQHHSVNKGYLKKFIDGTIEILYNDDGVEIGIMVVPK